MSPEKSNIAILKNAYETWAATKGGSVQEWLEIMRDDISIQSVAGGATGLEFTKKGDGKAAAAEYFAGLTSQLEMIHYTVDEYFASGDRVVAVGSTAWRSRTTGKEFKTPKIDVVRFDAGKIAETFELYDTAKVLAASQPDLKAVVMDAYDARRRENIDEIMSFFHPDAVFQIVANPELGDLSQTLRGLDELRAAMVEMCKAWDWTGRPITDIVVEGDRAVVHTIGEMHHAPTGGRFDYEILDKLTFKDGKIIEFIEFLARISQMIGNFHPTSP